MRKNGAVVSHVQKSKAWMESSVFQIALFAGWGLKMILGHAWAFSIFKILSFHPCFYVFRNLVFLGGQPIFRLRKPVSATCCDLWLRRPVESRPPQRKQLSRSLRCGFVWLGVNVTSSWENINSMQLSRSQDRAVVWPVTKRVVSSSRLKDPLNKGYSPMLF